MSQVLRRRIYTDTSVVGGCLDEEFSTHSVHLASGVIGAPHLEDARHIATATVQRVDILVSWNFKHIVNLDRIRGYNSINLRLGYNLLEIRSPQEVLRYEE